jgi:hypothetical protein
MKEKSFDVDEFLKEASYEIKLHGKSFFINDISEELIEKFNDENAKHLDLLQELLGCTAEDLKGYGAIALAAIIKRITDHFFQSDLLSGLSEGLNKSEPSATSST